MASPDTGIVVGALLGAVVADRLSGAALTRLFGVFAVLIVAGPWLLSLIIDFTRTLFQNIPFLVS